jgi:hypothetical protein
MKRSILAMCIWLSGTLLSTAVSAADVCPFSPGQLFINCPCEPASGRALIASADQCVGSGGRIAPGATSICDASCSVPRHTHVHRP